MRVLCRSRSAKRRDRAVFEAQKLPLTVALGLSAHELDESPALDRPVLHRHSIQSRSPRPAATIAAASSPSGMAPKSSARAGAGLRQRLPGSRTIHRARRPRALLAPIFRSMIGSLGLRPSGSPAPGEASPISSKGRRRAASRTSRRCAATEPTALSATAPAGKIERNESESSLAKPLGGIRRAATPP